MALFHLGKPIQRYLLSSSIRAGIQEVLRPSARTLAHLSMTNTNLTKLLGIRTPLVVSPMGGVSGGALAAQATNGGAFGFIAAGYEPAETLLSELSLARSLLQSNVWDGETLPIGVGYLGWLLEKMPSEQAEGLLLAALKSNIRALWFAFGNDLPRWIRFARENTSEGRKTPLIFVQVNSVKEAVYFAEELKADVIVAQGIESGGHGHGSAPPLSELLPSVVARFFDSPQKPIILAAGGLANGQDIASQIARGASGAVMGTRFLLTPESKYTDAQREALIAARSEDTVRTMAFDHARGTIDWPEGVDGRALRNDTVLDFDQGSSLEFIQTKFKEGIKNQDRSRFLVWAGTGVGSMNRVMPAKDVVQELHQEYEQHLL